MKIKRLFLAVELCLLAIGCTKLDEMKTRCDNLEYQVGTLRERLTALETIVAAIQAGDYITGVETVRDGDKTGYKLTFNKFGVVTVYDGADGEDGKDGDDMFKKIEVGADEVVFTTKDGTVFKIPRYASDHLNLPNNIIMVSEEMDDVIKKDTIILNIIANPSDFVVTKEKLSILAVHDIYTKYDIHIDPETEETTEDPFDPTAHCDLSIVECVKADGYEGAYNVAVAIGGEGNFYDDVKLYLLYGDKDHADNERYICSNTPAKIHVIPWIEEGLTCEFPQQSIYPIDIDTRKTGSEMKPVLGGLWLSRYKNAAGMIRIYDRSQITGLKCATDAMAGCCNLVDTLFQKCGIVFLNPASESTFWKDALKDYQDGKIKYTSFPESGIIISRGKEAKVLPVSCRLYFQNYFEHIINTTGDEIKAAGRKMSLNLTDDFENAGWNSGLSYSRHFGVSHSQGTVGSRIGGNIDLDTKMVEIGFWNTTPTAPDKPAEIYELNTLVIAGEDKDGSFFKVTNGNNRCNEVSFILERIQVNITE